MRDLAEVKEVRVEEVTDLGVVDHVANQTREAPLWLRLQREGERSEGVRVSVGVTVCRHGKMQQQECKRRGGGGGGRGAE